MSWAPTAHSDDDWMWLGDDVERVGVHNGRGYLIFVDFPWCFCTNAVSLEWRQCVQKLCSVTAVVFRLRFGSSPRSSPTFRIYLLLQFFLSAEISHDLPLPTTPLSRIMYHDRLVEFCKIWGFHGGDYEELCLLGCYAVWFLQEPHGVTTQKTPFFFVEFCLRTSTRM
jgi:hypothetical protein